MDSEKFEAIGPRGEACIILMRRNPLPNGQTAETWTLATGDRLRPAELPPAQAGLKCAGAGAHARTTGISSQRVV